MVLRKILRGQRGEAPWGREAKDLAQCPKRPEMLVLLLLFPFATVFLYGHPMCELSYSHVEFRTSTCSPQIPTLRGCPHAMVGAGDTCEDPGPMSERDRTVSRKHPKTF